MKKSKFIVVALCLFVYTFAAGCNSQQVTSSAGSQINPDRVSSRASTESSLTSNSSEVTLFTYDGLAPTPTDHKITEQMPQGTKEIKETVKTSDAVTPDKIMKLYMEKYLSESVVSGGSSFSYSNATMSKTGIITIDFTKEGARYLSSGSMLEINSLYGIGKSMLMNVEGAESVCYGIEGNNYSTEISLDRNTPYLLK